jgi:non-specific serine/threonine protein kinase
MDNITFDLWFTEDGYSVSGGDEWAKNLHEKPIDNLFEYLKSSDAIENLGLEFLSSFAKEFLIKVQSIDSLLLESKITIEINDTIVNQILAAIPLYPGSEYIDKEWIEFIWNKMEIWCYKTIAAFKGSIEACLSSYLPSFNVADRSYFHLVETENEQYPFGFLTSYTTKVNNIVKHMPLSYALEEFKEDERALLHLLSIIFKASKKSEVLSKIIEEGEIFDPTYLTTSEAYNLLKHSSYFKECGIGFRFPSWWKQKNKIHSQAKIGDELQSNMGMQSLLSVSLNFVIDDELLSEKDLLDLIGMEEGLVRFKNKWIEINHKRLQELLDQYEKFEALYGKGITFSQYLEMQRKGELDELFEDLTIEHGQWLSSFKNHKSLENKQLDITESFHGKLREYQYDGVNWLYNMFTSGFGTCLADDMGLGKTVQILAILGNLFENNILKNTLLIVPSSLIGNWDCEREKFLPSLPLYVLDKSEKILQQFDFEQKGLYITTYKMASLRESINTRFWDLIILDEAQAIKNPSAKQTKVIKTIESSRRIAMTGTPIENSITDLWSLFDFINPGLLGNKTEFTRLMKNTKNNPQIYSSLREVIQPFILRRLKTDKTIIKDLPKKIEKDMYVPLSTKQVLLYKKLVESATKQITEEKEGIGKNGLVLATILKSKQICNHPSQYLKGDEFKEKDSGKFLALKQLVEVIKDKHERMIVFTQYKTMIKPLCSYLESLFGYEGLYIDGGVSPKERSARVKEFNSDKYYPFMVITIKSGGTGLNLTSANHVVHFDRWWNPSVENQATDRAFRIGQTKVVNVYKFTCKGTIEDKINDIINDKKALSSSIIGKSEESTLSWITKLDDTKLKQLFAYSEN